MRLKGKVAVITGGARGIGRATALLFAREGAQVAVADLNYEEGRAVVSEIEGTGGEALYERVDVRDFGACRDFAERVVKHFGRVDVLVNNAGVIKDRTLIKMGPDEFDYVMDVNVKGVFNCTKAFVPYMVEQGYGVILNASSVVAMYGNFGQTNYVASKCAVIGMTKVWARELGPKGIRVNAVAPGFIDTDMTGSLPSPVKEEVVRRTPLGRMGRPEDVAYAYLFLASDEAAYINGAVLNVDGGLTL